MNGSLYCEEIHYNVECGQGYGGYLINKKLSRKIREKEKTSQVQIGFKEGCRSKCKFAK